VEVTRRRRTDQRFGKYLWPAAVVLMCIAVPAAAIYTNWILYICAAVALTFVTLAAILERLVVNAENWGTPERVPQIEPVERLR
jgi:hypothetical protein